MPPGPPEAPGTTRAPPSEGLGLTRLALSNPTATLVAVLLVVLFGGLGLARLPVQLTPEVEKPEITIRTGWRAAAPEEIEAEIIEPQEKVLRGLSGVSRIVSKAQRGQGEVSIEFVVGHDLRRGLIEVLNRLNRVPRYPEDANEPVIDTVGGNSRAIAWFTTRTRDGNPRDIQSYKDYAEEVVQTRFERVPGIARSEVYGGREREVRITFDPYRAASLGIELPVAARLAGANQDISGGDVSVGKRRYTLRFTGAFDAEDLGDLVLEWRDGLPVRPARRRRDRGLVRRPQELRPLERGAVARGERPPRDRSERPRSDGGTQGSGGGAHRRPARPRRPHFRAGLRRDGLHPPLGQHGAQQPRSRHHAGDPRALVVPAPAAGDGAHRGGDPDLALRLLPLSLHHRTDAQHHLPCGTCPGGGHDSRRRHCGAREHRPAARAGHKHAGGGHPGSGPGLGCAACLDRDHGGHLPPHRIPLRRGRPALRRPCPHHLGGGGGLDARGAHGDPRRGVEVARAGAAWRRACALEAWPHLRHPPPHRRPGEKGGMGGRIDRDTARDLSRPRTALDPESGSASGTIRHRAAGVALCVAGELPAPGQPEPRLRVHHPPARREHRPPRAGDGQRGGRTPAALPRRREGAGGRELLLRRLLPWGVHGGEDKGRDPHRRADTARQPDDTRLPRHHCLCAARLAFWRLRIRQHHRRQHPGPEHRHPHERGAGRVHRSQPGAPRGPRTTLPRPRARRPRAPSRARRTPPRGGGLEPRDHGLGDPRPRRRALRRRLLRRRAAPRHRGPGAALGDPRAARVHPAGDPRWRASR